MIIKVRYCFWFLWGFMFLAAARQGDAAIKIEIVYPREGSQVVAAEATFIFGNVFPVDVDLRVNNVATRVYPNGSFLAFVPVEPGQFSFTCQAVAGSDTATVVRNVYIPYYLRTSPKDSLAIDTSLVFPRENWTLQPGDELKIVAKGTPGCRASFSIAGMVSELPMVAVSPKKLLKWSRNALGERIRFPGSDVKGIYIGSYTIRSCDRAYQRQIRIRLKDRKGNLVDTVAPGRLSIYNAAIPQVGKLTHDRVIPYGTGRRGAQLFLPAGVKLWVTAQRGHNLRVRFPGMDELWIDDHQVESLLPGGSISSAVISNARIQQLGRKVRLMLNLNQPVPFHVDQATDMETLLITFFGVAIDKESVTIDNNDPLIRSIRWEPKAAHVYQAKIELRQKQQWGYAAFYKQGTFCLDIKKKPLIHDWLTSPLKDIVICLDPGHGPDSGAVGPGGFVERDMNYQYCRALKKALESRGAFVALTHGEKDGATLKARTQLARFMEADIFLSLHFNALPDGVDPFKNHGISTYYYHPHSYRLAWLLQKKMLRHTRLKNFGLFHNALAVCRPTEMIAVLIEPGFIMHPWEEILIASESYRQKVISAVVEAIEQFLKENR